MKSWHFSLALMVLSLSAYGASDRYVVKKSDNLGSIAASVYSASWQASWLQAANNIKDANSLKAGQVLKVPQPELYEVVSGDSLAKISKKFFKTTKRVDYIKYANPGISDEIKVSQKIVIPFVIRHRVTSTDTPEKIAKRIYRDKSFVKSILSFNELKTKGALKKQKYIWLPVRPRLHNFRKDNDKISAKIPKAKVNVKTKPKKEVRQLYVPSGVGAGTLPLVDQMLFEGRYLAAKGVLDKIPERKLKSHQSRMDYFDRQVTVNVALNRLKSARVYLGRVKKFSSKEKWEEYLSNASPKIKFLTK